MDQLIRELKEYLDVCLAKANDDIDKIRTDMLAKIDAIKDSAILMEIKKVNDRLNAIETKLLAPEEEDED